MKKIKPYLAYLFAFLAGALMPLGFAPFNWGIAAIASFVIFLWCLNNKTPGKAFMIGGFYGIGMFGFGASWVYVSIHDYGYTNVSLAVLITFLFILLLATFPAVMAYLLNYFFKRNDIKRNLLAFPTLWVFFEMARSWVLTGFPWLFVGYTQMANHLRAFAPVASVWGVSWITTCVAAILYLIIEYYYTNKTSKKLRNFLFISMFAVWAVAFGLSRITWTVPSDQKVIVSLVQGNIPQPERWDPQFVDNIIQTYEKLTAVPLNTANIIIWPEGAIPVPLPLSQAVFQKMNDLATAHNVALFAGVPVQLADQEHYYSAIVSMGEGVGVYYKQHLVPFGEFVPFEKLFRGIIAFLNLPMSSFISGPYHQEPLTAFGLKIAPAICYEIAYPLFVQRMSQNADVIFTVSNDSWFGASIGPAQHLQIAQFRALETGKYVVRATNTGITAIIEPNDEIQVMAPQFETTVLTGSFTPMIGQTFWVRYGIWPLWGFMALMLALAFYLRIRQKN